MSSESDSSDSSSHGEYFSDEEGFFRNRFGERWQSSFNRIDTDASENSAKWGPNQEFLTDIKTVPAAATVTEMDARGRLGLPMNADHLNAKYAGVTGISNAITRLQQPPGDFDPVTAKWKTRDLLLPQLINPCGCPNVKPLFNKKDLNKVLRSAAKIDFEVTTDTSEVAAALRQRALAEVLLAVQHIAANMRSVATYLHRFQFDTWKTTAPFFCNYTHCLLLADEAMQISAQAQQLEAGKLEVAKNFRQVFQARTKRLLLPADTAVRRHTVAFDTGFRQPRRQSANVTPPPQPPTAGRRRKRNRGRGRGRKRQRTQQQNQPAPNRPRQVTRQPPRAPPKPPSQD